MIEIPITYIRKVHLEMINKCANTTVFIVIGFWMFETHCAYFQRVAFEHCHTGTYH